MTTSVLIPIKRFAAAKSRLRGVLSAADTERLARRLAAETIRHAAQADRVDRIVLLGHGPELVGLANEANAEVLVERDSGSLSDRLNDGVARLALAASDTLAIVPSDLPKLDAAAIDALLAQHSSGLTLCPAARDGGTNALVLTPPDAIPLCFGPNSARRHGRAGRDAGIEVRTISLDAFRIDLDVPEDLAHWTPKDALPFLAATA